MNRTLVHGIVDTGALLCLGALAATGCADAGGPPLAASNGRAVAAECALPSGARSFDQQKTDPSLVDGSCVPEYTSADLEAAFLAIRDRRPLATGDQPGFARRIPWLFVQSGCEERAMAAAYFLTQWGYQTPYFARVVPKPRAPQLGLATDNDPTGAVRWSSHVAPVVRIADQLMILDPALDHDRPLRLADWLARFSQPGQIAMALCRDAQKGDACFTAAPTPPEAQPAIAMPYTTLYDRLDVEWRLQKVLGRDPDRLLGDCPPWRACATPEPAADPDRAPHIRELLPDEFSSVIYPETPLLYISGDNFVPGVTSVHIVGPGGDELAPIADIKRLRILINEGHPAGTYQVTAANGAHVGNTATLVIQE